MNPYCTTAQAAESAPLILANASKRNLRRLAALANMLLKNGNLCAKFSIRGATYTLYRSPDGELIAGAETFMNIMDYLESIKHFSSVADLIDFVQGLEL